jgi:hypothetical protein
MSYMFNDFLRDDIFPLSETIFGTQLSAFHHLANKKYQSPMGDYIARTIERKIWIKKQLKSIDKKIIEATKPVNREAIIKVDARLTKRMSEDLMPVYIKHLIKTNIKTLKRFNKDFFKFRKHNRSGLSTLAQKLETLKDPSIDSRSYLSAQRKVTDSLHLVLAQTGKVKRFCDYLKYTTTRTGATDKLCEQDVFKIQAYYSALKNFQSEFDAMQAFDLWADENLNILSSRVMDYADSIRAWAERGDERWIEYIDQTEVTVEVNVEQEEQSWFSTDPFSLK